MNPKLKSALWFVGGVILSLLAVKLFQTYVLPKAPDSIKKVAAKVLPNV